MTKSRTSRRLFGGVAATAAGLSTIAVPATAGANEITIDLGTLATIGQESSSGSGESSSNEEIVNGLMKAARSVTVNGNNLGSSNSATAAENDAAEANAGRSTSDASDASNTTNSDTVVDPQGTKLEGVGDQYTEYEDEIEALDLANERPSDKGETADGRTVYFPTKGRFTSGYGERWGTIHRGIDIANSIGTPIRAVMDGKVIATGPAQGYGNWVVIEHDHGEKSIYGHMANRDVVPGQYVSAGDKIAEIGNEGRSTGPHLHFEIHPTGDGAVDPVPWFAEQGISVDQARQ
ncbi:M23 family peptidase [Corynebacterium yudongzhengii]|uniref:M23 family peptidase n=1 Tax=Corynebacterium yudongzhengii TaxID=2080740 RepID=A0A2U1T7V1_9CORY|nr:M23 family metallopeptidase [Corynebacterium yudongzhengii]AWB82318.1 M23 family peptidase [Corynebacterium yudongzhengii]PWC02063.1 M23 family peptidase [Corynebacterium yudongzhengii]